MSGLTFFLRGVVLLGLSGGAAMIPALFLAPPESKYFVRAGLACVSLASAVNAVAGFTKRRMWGRVTVISPEEIYGGASVFFGLAMLYCILALVCGVGAVTFMSKVP